MLPNFTSVTNSCATPFEMPSIVFGTYKLKQRKVVTPLLGALDAGMTMIDTAFVYNNEREIGHALSEHPRGCQVLIVTKLWRSHMSNDVDSIRARLDDHIRCLGKPVCLWLIHWPGPGVRPSGEAKPSDWTPSMRVHSYRSMLSLLGPRCNSVGVSNFSVRQIQQLFDETGKVC
jgi:diketogulonate reductase-like aldo/keto reductase